MDTRSDIWAITSYFNPLRYRRRRVNYATFRAHLQVPLLTVELCFGEPELSDRDAEVYVGLRGGALLWQKERLLNVALRSLPPHVKYVAWVDCDVVFDRVGWPDEARTLLSRCELVQPFSRMYRLSEDQIPATVDIRSMDFGTSVAQLFCERRVEPHDFRPTATPNNLNRRRGLFGLAWVAKRDLLEKHGIYDAMIVGSGDRALVCAAVNRAADAVEALQLSPIRAQHYLNWAAAFHADVQSKVGFVDGALLHCWHGDSADRRYMERHADFARLDFDPQRDVRICDSGLWTWTGPGQRLEPFMSNYFAGRREDGAGGAKPIP